MTLHDTARAFSRSIHHSFGIEDDQAADLFRFLWREMVVGIHAPVLQHAIETVAEALEIEGRSPDERA
jgi:hypothetical protein